MGCGASTIATNMDTVTGAARDLGHAVHAAGSRPGSRGDGKSQPQSPSASLALPPAGARDAKYGKPAIPLEPIVCDQPRRMTMPDEEEEEEEEEKEEDEAQPLLHQPLAEALHEETEASVCAHAAPHLRDRPCLASAAAGCADVGGRCMAAGPYVRSAAAQCVQMTTSSYWGVSTSGIAPILGVLLKLAHKVNAKVLTSDQLCVGGCQPPPRALVEGIFEATAEPSAARAVTIVRVIKSCVGCCGSELLGSLERLSEYRSDSRAVILCFRMCWCVVCARGPVSTGGADSVLSVSPGGYGRSPG